MPDPHRFGDSVAIVTGAGGGIGAGIARRLSSEGAKVVVADIKEGEADATVRNMGAGMAIRCDVSKEEDVEACVDAALGHYGRIDIIVNNAAVMTFKSLETWSKADWVEILEINLIGAALFTKAGFIHMKSGGAIINVASVHAVMTSADVAPYAAAKAGLLSLTRSSAIEGKAKGIRANAVLPGAIDTAMLRANPNVASGAEVVAESDVGRVADVASAVAFLASADSRFITGASIVVDGGRLSQL